MSFFNRIPVFNDPYVRRLFAYLPPYKKLIAAAVCCMILGGGASSLIAILLGKLTDMGFYEHNPLIVWLTPLGLIGISILHGGTQFLSSYLLQKVSQGVLVQVRNLMFSRVITWSSQSYQHHLSGRIVSKFINEASAALGSAAEILTTIVRDSLQIIFLACILIYHNWLLTLVTLVVAPL